MTDITTSVVRYNGARHVALHITNQSDGTGESGVTKLDLTNIQNINNVAPSSLTLMEAQWDTTFDYVVVSWKRASGGDVMLVCNGDGSRKFYNMGGLHDPGGTGTGDIMVTTNGTTAGMCYDIYLYFKVETS